MNTQNTGPYLFNEYFYSILNTHAVEVCAKVEEVLGQITDAVHDDVPHDVVGQRPVSTIARKHDKLYIYGDTDVI